MCCLHYRSQKLLSGGLSQLPSLFGRSCLKISVAGRLQWTQKSTLPWSIIILPSKSLMTYSFTKRVRDHIKLFSVPHLVINCFQATFYFSFWPSELTSSICKHQPSWLSSFGTFQRNRLADKTSNHRGESTQQLWWLGRVFRCVWC